MFNILVGDFLMIIAGNKYYKNNQIVVPKEIRDKQKLNNLDPDDIVVDWITKGNEIKIRFRKKRKPEELEGLVNLDYETNAVELKEELYK